MKPLDVAVVGAGPGGLAASLFLHRAGHRVTLFERFATPAPVGSGLILQPTGLTVLDALGLLPAIASRGNRIDRLEGRSVGRGRTVLDVRYDALAGGRHGIAIHRAALFEVLHDVVTSEGIAVETSSPVVDLVGGDRRRLVTQSGATLPGSFDLVVDASGTGSALRENADGRSRERSLAYGAFWTTVDLGTSTFDRRALTQRYERARVMIGVLPLGRPFIGDGEKAAFFWSLRAADLDAFRERGAEAFRRDVAVYWPAAAALIASLDRMEDLAFARYVHRTLSLPVGRGLAVIGDAAHSTSPQLGQGANMALLDAAALAHALDRSTNLGEALAAYVAARRRHVRLFQALSYWLTPLYQSDRLAPAILRDLTVGGVGRLAPLRRLMAAVVSGTVLDPLGRAGLTESDWSSKAIVPNARPSPN